MNRHGLQSNEFVYSIPSSLSELIAGLLPSTIIFSELIIYRTIGNEKQARLFHLNSYILLDDPANFDLP